jgi:AcrR family transcriptional regulator
VTDNKRDRILDTAFELFAQYGFLKTTVEEIAAGSHVGKGTIYSYFESKEDILTAVVDREMTQGFQAISKAMYKEQRADGKLRALLETTFDYFHKNPMISKVMPMDQGIALSVIKERNKAYQRMSIASIQALLEHGHNEGVFRKVDFYDTAYTIDSLIRSFHYLNYLGLETRKPSEMIDSIMDLLLSGLESK